MRENPDHHDAELLLRLYDLRREAKLRQARDWFGREFQVGSLEELNQKYPPSSESNTYLRMVVGYWEMVASIVNHGLIKQEFFFESTGEFYFVWERIKAFVPAFREQFKNPLSWKNLERLAESYEKYMAKVAPDAIETMRKMIMQPAKKQ